MFWKRSEVLWIWSDMGVNMRVNFGEIYFKTVWIRDVPCIFNWLVFSLLSLVIIFTSGAMTVSHSRRRYVPFTWFFQPPFKKRSRSNVHADAWEPVRSDLVFVFDAHKSPLFSLSVAIILFIIHNIEYN